MVQCETKIMVESSRKMLNGKGLKPEAYCFLTLTLLFFGIIIGNHTKHNLFLWPNKTEAGAL